MRDRKPPEDAALLGVTYGSQSPKQNIVYQANDAKTSARRTRSFCFSLLTLGPLRCRRATQAKREVSGPACLSPAAFCGASSGPARFAE
jgi:hypothetical protein